MLEVKDREKGQREILEGHGRAHPSDQHVRAVGFHPLAAPKSVAGNLVKPDNRETDAVHLSPDEPADGVPRPDNSECQNDGDCCGHLAGRPRLRGCQLQRNEEIAADEHRERNVPTLPEHDKISCHERIVEVFRRGDTHQLADADGNVAVGAEIEIEREKKEMELTSIESSWA